MSSSSSATIFFSRAFSFPRLRNFESFDLPERLAEREQHHDDQEGVVAPVQHEVADYAESPYQRASPTATPRLTNAIPSGPVITVSMIGWCKGPSADHLTMPRRSRGWWKTKAWPLVEPLLDAPWREALERLDSLRGTDRVTDDVATILGAAYDGRVQTLFLDLEANVFGTFDFETRDTVVHGADAGVKGDDLASLAGRWVYDRGGEVYATTNAELPDGTPLAAIMRY